MVFRLLVISLLFLSIKGTSQTKVDSILYDSVFISQVSVNGFSIGDNQSLVIEAFGKPSYSYKGISEISEEEFSNCKFSNDSISLLFDNNNRLYYFEYFMAKGYEIIVDKQKFEIGDDFNKLKIYFPDSFSSYMIMKDKGAVGLFLKGKSDSGDPIGIDFNIVIKSNRIYSFSSMEEF